MDIQMPYNSYGWSDSPLSGSFSPSSTAEFTQYRYDENSIPIHQPGSMDSCDNQVSIPSLATFPGASLSQSEATPMSSSSSYFLVQQSVPAHSRESAGEPITTADIATVTSGVTNIPLGVTAPTVQQTFTVAEIYRLIWVRMSAIGCSDEVKRFGGHPDWSDGERLTWVSLSTASANTHPLLHYVNSLVVDLTPSTTHPKSRHNREPQDTVELMFDGLFASWMTQEQQALHDTTAINKAAQEFSHKVFSDFGVRDESVAV